MRVERGPVAALTYLVDGQGVRRSREASPRLAVGRLPRASYSRRVFVRRGGCHEGQENQSRSKARYRGSCSSFRVRDRDYRIASDPAEPNCAGQWKLKAGLAPEEYANYSLESA
jgi:hypothetical protein